MAATIKLGKGTFMGHSVDVTMVAWYGDYSVMRELHIATSDGLTAAHALPAIDAGNVTVGELLGSLALIDAVEDAETWGVRFTRRSHLARQPFAGIISALAQERDLQAAAPAWHAEGILREAL